LINSKQEEKVLNKKLLFILLIFLSMVTLMRAQSKGTIVFALRMDTVVVDPVTNEWPDMTWVHALEDEGYDVTLFYNSSLSTADQSSLDTLLNANLVIIGRSVPTLYLGGNSVDDKIAWNDLPVPVLTGNMWAMRSSRLNWFNSTNIITLTDSIVYNAIIDEPGDPVFEGLDVSGPVPWWDSPNDELGTADFGNGLLLAESETDGSVLFVRFEADYPFYDGTDDYPAGPRSYIGNGRDASSLPPFYYFNFTPESKQVLFAEVARMVKLGGGPSSDVKFWGNSSLPSTPVLSQNYPNPFNPTTKIKFSINERAYTNLTVYNSLGQRIVTLVDKELNSGRYDVTFNATNLPSGIYLYQIHSGNFSEVRKMILIK
jgi:hypothetical protein